MKNTAVVILNFNGVHFLKQFLGNVLENSPEADVVLIDNNSSDESVSFVKNSYSEVQIIQLNENLGFAGGYNEGLKDLKYEYFVLLNSDVEVTKGWLQPLIDRISTSPNIAAVQPKLLDFNRKEYFEYAGGAGGMLDVLGYPFCRGRVFDSIEKDNGQFETTEEIFWATGACFFVKAQIFNELGGFDALFFAHMEEIDLCWRMQNAGYSIVYEPKSEVYHVGGGTLHKSNPFKTFLNFRNNLAMLLKNLPSQKLFPIIFARLILDGVSSLKLWKDNSFQDFWAVARAHMAFYGMIPYLWKKRNGNYVGFNKLVNKSIVWQYFAKNKKTYSEICSK